MLQKRDQRGFHRIDLAVGCDIPVEPALLVRGHDMVGAFFSGTYATHTFANEQRFNFNGLKGRLLSSSYAPAAGQLHHDEMMADLRRIYDVYQVSGQVCFEYDTRVHLGH